MVRCEAYATTRTSVVLCSDGTVTCTLAERKPCASPSGWCSLRFWTRGGGKKRRIALKSVWPARRSKIRARVRPAAKDATSVVVVVVGTFGLCDDGETLLYTARREYERIMIYTERVKTKRNKSLYICIYIFFFWGGKRNEIFFLFCLQNYWLLYAFRIVCLFTKIYIFV